MTAETSATVLGAAQQLLRNGQLGVVRLDAAARVVERQGPLVAWVPLRPAAEALPFLVGYEDVIAAVRAGETDSYALPNMTLAASEVMDGTVFAVQIFAGGGPDDVVLLFQDVTGVAALEQRVVQTRNELTISQRALVEAKRAAEAASAAKSRFLGMISHDLRTPLNVLIGNAEILLDEAAAPQPASVTTMRPYVDDILDNGRYLLELIEDLLDLARGEADALDLDLEPVTTADVVEEALRMVSGLRAAEPLIVESQLEPDLPAILGDRRRLKQIFVNLLTNAVKFTPAGGRVSIAAAPHPDGGVIVVVADTGIGIAAADLDYVFEPFAQIHAVPPGDADRGAGLGLTVARMLIERHAGCIAITSTLGVGTTVTVTLPTIGSGSDARRR